MSADRYLPGVIVFLRFFRLLVLAVGFLNRPAEAHCVRSHKAFTTANKTSGHNGHCLVVEHDKSGVWHPPCTQQTGLKAMGKVVRMHTSMQYQRLSSNDSSQG